MIKYSTEEQVIGEWIDGKPLYKKTIFISMAGETSKSVDTGISNMGLCANLYGVGKLNSVNNILVPLTFYNTSGWNSVHLTSSGAKMLVASNEDLPLADVYITMEYTKTTD